MKKKENAPKRQKKAPITAEHLQEIINILKGHNELLLELRTDSLLFKQNLVAINNLITPAITDFANSTDDPSTN